MTVHHIAVFLLFRSKSRVPLGEGGDYRGCDSLRGHLRVCAPHLSSQSPVICWAMSSHIFSLHIHYLPFSQNVQEEIPYVQITVLTSGFLDVCHRLPLR